ncbi:uncharacterized protein LOC122659328 [Telopea speciosissima]|uniref:uncharacterized protein LOC122659328 n=1 Tax=Telopea speciosissima TaxID=54955 RepID=UPI001CC73292|nr:uncharacterized protein LOC122659328 [Telopea speciosissima]
MPPRRSIRRAERNPPPPPPPIEDAPLPPPVGNVPLPSTPPILGTNQQDFVGAMTAFMNFVQTQAINAVATNAPHPHRHPYQGDSTGRVMERFKKLGPLVFKGVGMDPLWPAVWVEEMEKIFLILGCTDAQKVACATFMLQGEAHMWWKAHNQIMVTVDPVITWARFTWAFFDSYFPDSMKEAKEIEFLTLTPGTNSVMAYKNKFEDLAYFTEDHVSIDEKKAKKFMRGLKAQLKGAIVTLKLTYYADVL